jgi:hypothetical protein
MELVTLSSRNHADASGLGLIIVESLPKLIAKIRCVKYLQLKILLSVQLAIFFKLISALFTVDLTSFITFFEFFTLFKVSDKIAYIAHLVPIVTGIVTEGQYVRVASLLVISPISMLNET